VRRAAFLVAVLALALAAPATASERHPSQDELENEVMCPVCKPETIAQSDAPLAQRMKAYIGQRIAAGDTKSQIENKLVAQFGRSVLASPSRHGFDLLAWLLPILGALAGAGALAALAWRWSRTRSPAVAPAVAGPPLDPELERRLDDELRRFDA
jgi:cytochrome c-type biogenesis protein CcmH